MPAARSKAAQRPASNPVRTNDAHPEAGVPSRQPGPTNPVLTPQAKYSSAMRGFSKADQAGVK
jgi:hypothetical protein